MGARSGQTTVGHGGSVEPATWHGIYRGVLAVVTASVLLAGCYSGPGADHFIAVVDDMGHPAGWEIANTVVRGPGQANGCNPGVSNECPAVRRYFVTDGTIDGAYEDAKALVARAGFSVSEEGTKGCARGSSTGPPCGFFADKAGDQVHVGVFASPLDAGLDDGPSGVTVVVAAYGTD